MTERVPVLYISEEDVHICLTSAGTPDKLGKGGQGEVSHMSLC